MGLIINPYAFGATAPGVSFTTKSLSMSDGSDTLTRVQGAGASRRKMTFSFWFRTSDVTNALTIFSSANSSADLIAFSSGLSVLLNGGADGLIVTTGVSISNNTWYHAVVQLDTANATAADRCKIFVNGVDRTFVFAAITLNYDTGWGLNGDTEGGPTEASGIATTLVDEFSKIDNNQLLGPSSFANGANYVPSDISGLTFGAQGYWLRFETATGANEGVDSSGNGLTFTSTYDDADSSTTIP